MPQAMNFCLHFGLLVLSGWYISGTRLSCSSSLNPKQVFRFYAINDLKQPEISSAGAELLGLRSGSSAPCFKRGLIILVSSSQVSTSLKISIRFIRIILEDLRSLEHLCRFLDDFLCKRNLLKMKMAPGLLWFVHV